MTSWLDDNHNDDGRFVPSAMEPMGTVFDLYHEIDSVSPGKEEPDAAEDKSSATKTTHGVNSDESSEASCSSSSSCKTAAADNTHPRAGLTPLHEAAKRGLLDKIKSLVEGGEDVNVQNGKGDTPLYYAVLNGHTEIAEILIRNSANVGTKSPVLQRTLLHVAASKGRCNIIKLLVQSGVDPNLPDRIRVLPMHLFCLNIQEGTTEDLHNIQEALEILSCDGRAGGKGFLPFSHATPLRLQGVSPTGHCGKLADDKEPFCSARS